MQFLSWLLWSVKCHFCCFFSSPSWNPGWNYRSENRNYRNKQPLLQSNHLKTCKIYKYSSANANFSKSSHKGHKTKGQILKHSNDSLWTKPSEILAFTAMFRIYCIPRTLKNCWLKCISDFCLNSWQGSKLKRFCKYLWANTWLTYYATMNWIIWK